MIRFTNESVAAARRQTLGDGLLATVRDSGLRASRDQATGDVVATDSQGRSTRLALDQRGFVGAVVSPLGRRWGITSDGKGRPLSLTTPAGGRLDLAYDASGPLTRISRGERTLATLGYDPSGAVDAYRFADGTSTRLAHDPAGRVTALTDRRGVTRTLDHTPDGLLSGMTDGRGHRTEFAYAGVDRPARATLPDGSTTGYTYDPAGLLRSVAAHDGTTTTLTHDEAGRLVAVDAGGDRAQFTRDEAGRITRAENSTTAVEFTYDAAGRVATESRAGAKLRYEYDAGGTLAGLVYPTGERVGFGHDADGRLTSVTAWDGATWEFDHAPDDRWLLVRAPGGLISSIEWTPEGQLSAVAVRTALRPQPGGRPPIGGDDLFRTAYTYDGEDRLARVVDSEHGERQFRYDAEGQLIGAGRESFGYDAAGNRVEVNGQSAVFDPADRLVAQGRIRCEYDGRGNLATLQDGADSWRYTWDAHNRLTRAEAPGGRVVTFGYDAFGRRVWKRSGDRTTHFFWAGETLVREVSSDSTSRDYLYPPGATSPLAIRERGVVHAVHADHLGTPRRLTDPNGAVAWSADADAFGQVRPTPRSTLAPPIRFPGHYADDETGLHYNRFRYYSPTLGRYLSPDPASYHGGLNLYVYVGNDPVNGVDPTGLWPSWRSVLPVLAAVAVGVAVVLLAPVSIPTILVAGALAGAVGAGLNQALNEQTFCAECIAKAALKGALVGTVAALPFAFLPAAAGLGAVMGAGGLSGGISYAGDHLLNGTPMTWGGLALSVGLGAATAGAGRYLAGRYAQWRAGQTPPTAVSPTMEQKILYGERVVDPATGNPTRKLIGAHSPDIINRPDYTVRGKLANGDEVVLPDANAVVNADGTQKVKVVQQFPDGVLSKPKTSTLAPDHWSNQDIIDATHQVGETPKLGTRASDGVTWHRETVNGVEWEVLKDPGGNVVSSYPTGGGAGPLGGFTPTVPGAPPPVAGPASVGTTTTANQPTSNPSGSGP